MKRKDVEFCLFACVVFGAAIAVQPALSETVKFIGPGVADPIIVVGTGATESERFAAEELSTHLGEMTGRKIAIMDEPAYRGCLSDDNDRARGKVIAVGVSGLTALYDISALGVEQYIIDIKPEMAVIVGGRLEPVGGLARDRGTLYGVYDFLEGLGVRWYRPEPWGWHIPKLDSVELQLGKGTSDPPAFFYRANLSGGLMRWGKATPENTELAYLWSSRQRLNRDTRSNRYGGAVYYNYYHCYNSYVPASKYLESNPEYFALVGGKRGGGRSQPQLCLSNRQLQELFVKKLIELARANPHFSSLSLEPNDGTGSSMCECASCVAMDDPNHPHTVTNRLMAFNNIVARKFAAAVPEMKLHALAYSAHTAPPTIVDYLESNIIVMIAPINAWSDWTKELLDPTSVWNSKLVNAIKEWSKLRSNVWVYEYWAGYNWLGPIPMEKMVAEKIRSYRDLGVQGIYNETHPSWGPQGLLMYVTAKLQWDPDIDIDAELAVYYRNYYGPAAGPMQSYHERWQKAFENSRGTVVSGGAGMHMLCRPALIAELGVHMNSAQQMVRGKPLYERRLAGVRAGYELSRRVSEIMSLKLVDKDSVLTPQKPRGRYQKSPMAEAAWPEFEKWLAGFGDGDAIFDLAVVDGELKKNKMPVHGMYSCIIQHGQWYLGNEDVLLKELGF